MKYITQTAVIFCLILLAGCSIFPAANNQKTHYYDLTQPPRITLHQPLEVLPFVTTSGDRFRMAARIGKSEIAGDDFHKWILPPGSLLTKYLRLAFRDTPETHLQSEEDPMTLNGEILTFEISGKYAELGVRYHLNYKKKQLDKTILLREKLAEETPAGFAAAMSKTAEKFAGIVATDANRMSQTISKKK